MCAHNGRKRRGRGATRLFFPSASAPHRDKKRLNFSGTHGDHTPHRPQSLDLANGTVTVG